MVSCFYPLTLSTNVYYCVVCMSVSVCSSSLPGMFRRTRSPGPFLGPSPRHSRLVSPRPFDPFLGRTGTSIVIPVGTTRVPTGRPGCVNSHEPGRPYFGERERPCSFDLQVVVLWDQTGKKLERVERAVQDLCPSEIRPAKPGAFPS